MLEYLNKSQKITFWVMLGLSILSLLIIGCLSYIMITTRRPETLGVSYATTINASTGEIPICEVEIWSNDNNNGEKLYEVQWNSYTDSEGNGIKGFGIQIIGDYEVRERGIDYKTTTDVTGIARYSVMNNTVFIGESYLYNTDDLGESSYALELDKVNDTLYINIEDTYYSINLKEHSTTYLKTDVWSTVNLIFGNPKYETITSKYSWYSMADYIIQSALRDSARENNSVYYINYLDCADYYYLLEYNGRQYVELPDVTDLRNYMQIKITYHKDGATKASDSMFHQIANSTTWAYDDGTNAEDYWTDDNSYIITESMLSRLESSYYDGYYLTIDSALMYEFLNKNVSVYINLDNLNYDVVGIDMTYFVGPFESFIITSTEQQDFKILNVRDTIPTLTGGLA